MFKIFRRFRNKYISENKVSRYLLYATGEIALVVIGILIALVINQKANQNSEQKEALIILKEIHSNLILDLEAIIDDIWAMDSVDYSCNFIVNYLEDHELPNAEFGKFAHFSRITPHFSANISGYNLLSSKGIQIVKNDSLRQAISNYFDASFPYYKAYEEEKMMYRLQVYDPFLPKYFKWIKDSTDMTLGYYEISPEDYIKMRNQGEFQKIVASVQRENYLARNRANILKKSIIALSQSLQHEIKLKS